MFMLISLFGWWYGPGWLQLVARIKKRIGRTVELFSITQLLGSLFAPFRQVGTDRVVGPVKTQLQAFADKEFSRLMGFIFRSLIIVAGLIALAIVMTISLLILIAWPLLPFVPLIGLFMFIGGSA